MVGPSPTTSEVRTKLHSRRWIDLGDGNGFQCHCLAVASGDHARMPLGIPTSPVPPPYSLLPL